MSRREKGPVCLFGSWHCISIITSSSKIQNQHGHLLEMISFSFLNKHLNVCDIQNIQSAE